MRASLLLWSFPLLLAISTTGCVADEARAGDEVDDDVESSESAATAGPATASVEASGDDDLRVRAGGMTVWADAVAVARDAGPAGGPHPEPWITLRLRTSRSLENAASYVPEDGFGNARIVSPRVVEIDLRGGHEIHSMMSGAPLYVHLRTTTGSPREYDVRLELSTILTQFEGSANAMVDREVRPVWVKDGVTNLRYRGRVRATGPTGPTSMSARMNGQHATLLPLGNRAFRFDFTPERFAGGLVSPGAAMFTATIRSNRYIKTASVDVLVARVGLTKQGVTVAWPEAACKPAVSACIQAAGAAATDLGACGTYRDVTRCLPPE